MTSSETGILAPPRNQDALADEIVGLLADEPRRKALGLAARAVAVECYLWMSIAGRLEEIYRAVCGLPAETAT